MPGDVLTVTLTEAGRALAARLPYRHRHGALAGTVRAEWERVDGFVLVASVGLAVRVLAPLLRDKHRDPAVVCVDDAGRWAVAVLGGHGGGANQLAREVAGLLGGEAVLSTASDATGLPALDQLPGFTAAGDLAGVTRRLLDGAPAILRMELEWPVPAPLAALAGGARGAPPGRTGRTGEPDVRTTPGPVELVVTDRAGVPGAGTVHLHPAQPGRRGRLRSRGVGGRGPSAARRHAGRDRPGPGLVGAGGDARPQGDRAGHRRPGPGSRPAAAFVHRRCPGPPTGALTQRGGRRRRGHTQRGRGGRPQRRRPRGGNWWWPSGVRPWPPWPSPAGPGPRGSWPWWGSAPATPPTALRRPAPPSGRRRS